MAHDHIVVLGGGIGGIVAVNTLRDRIDNDASITLVDKSPVHTFKPTFLRLVTGESEIATASLREDHTEIERRIDALAADEPGGASLPLRLHELSALILHHFQKEEDVLFPYLERTLDRDEFNALLETLLAHDDT